MEKPKTFKEWLKIREGLWLNDANAGTNSPGQSVKSKLQSKRQGGGSLAPMGGGGGFSNMALGGR
jgi:hypothetical protein